MCYCICKEYNYKSIDFILSIYKCHTVKLNVLKYIILCGHKIIILINNFYIVICLSLSFISRVTVLSAYIIYQ